MSAYGMCKWICGKCGDSYEADGVVAESKVERWMRDHKEQHRVSEMSPEDRWEYQRSRNDAIIWWCQRNIEAAERSVRG